MLLTNTSPTPYTFYYYLPELVIVWVGKVSDFSITAGVKRSKGEDNLIRVHRPKGAKTLVIGNICIYNKG